jgi:lysophospholipase L1-like esterase
LTEPAQVTAARSIDLVRFWRAAFFLQALTLALVALAYSRDWLPWTTPVGMTDRPCREEGLPITGKPSDDWASLCLFRADNARIAASGMQPKAVFIGDSITEYWPYSDNRIFAPGIVNRGLGGQTSSHLLQRFPQDVVALRPAVVHILVGINDIAGLTGPVSPDTYQANIRAMVDIAQANGIRVILGTIPPAREFPWRPKLKPLPWQPDINRWLIAFAKERGLIIADYAEVLSAKEGLIRPEFYKDAVHLNQRGYAAMYDVTLRALAASEPTPKSVVR